MSDLQKAGAGLAGAGVILVLARLADIAQGQQYVIGGAFILVGAAMYVIGRRST